MDKIYILKRDRILLGPYTVAKLEERTLRSSDLVWYEGLVDWTAAGNIPELQTAISNADDEEPTAVESFKSKIINLFSSRK